MQVRTLSLRGVAKGRRWLKAHQAKYQPRPRSVRLTAYLVAMAFTTAILSPTPAQAVTGHRIGAGAIGANASKGPGTTFQSQTAQPPDGCAQVRVVAARGSGQNPFTANSGMGPEVETFYASLKRLLSGVDVRYWADPYPAVAVSSFAYGPDYKGSRYSGSVQQGELLADRYVHDHLNGCPSEHLVIAGYSQGAHVLHDIWNKYAGNGGLDKLRGRLDGVVLFADPHFDASQRNPVPDYSLDIGTFTQSNHGGILGSNAVVWTPQQETTHFMHSYCRGGDPVCDAVGWDVGIHTTYADNGIPQGAAESLSRWLSGHYFH